MLFSIARFVTRSVGYFLKSVIKTRGDLFAKRHDFNRIRKNYQVSNALSLSIVYNLHYLSLPS